MLKKLSKVKGFKVHWDGKPLNQLKDEDLVGIDFAQIYVLIKEKEDLMEKAKMKSF